MEELTSWFDNMTFITFQRRCCGDDRSASNIKGNIILQDYSADNEILGRGDQLRLLLQKGGGWSGG